MASRQEPYVTPEEYLARERAGETKHEYLDGRVYAMAGASTNHNRIVFDLARDLGVQLRGRRCEGFASDMRLKVVATGLYTYADLFVLCDDPRFDDEKRDTIVNPSAIIEVLSPSTEAYDRGDKFMHCRQIPSLREYVLVAQDEVHIERFTRDVEDGSRWVLTDARGPDAVVELPSVGCVLRLRDVYERVDVPVWRPLRAVREPAEPAIFYTDAREPV